MKIRVVATLTFLLPICLLAGDHWWAFEYSDSKVIRQVDYRPASRIEITGGLGRLLKERNGKLAPYFEGKSPRIARHIIANLGYNAALYAEVGRGAYVALDQVVSVEYLEQDGGEVCILRGFSS